MNSQRCPRARRRAKSHGKAAWHVALPLAVSACGGGGGGDAPPNTAPTAQPASLSTDEDAVLAGTFSATDSDGDRLSYSVATAPTQGNVVIVGGGPGFSYTPAANFSGTDQFAFSVTDGRGGAATANVSIVVRAINDPPTITLGTFSPTLFARSTGEVQYSVADVDGPNVSIAVVQTGGTPVSDLASTATATSFTAPNSARVEPVTLVINADDGAGGTATHTASVVVYPLSPSGKMTTLVGGPAEAGVHWVITGDGYTESELGAFRQHAVRHASYVLTKEPINKFSVGWNVHLIDTASAQSGIDVPAESIAVDTAFDSHVCLERVMCLNAGKVFTAVSREHPTFDLVLVLGNTDRYVGGGGIIATASATNPLAQDIVLHELGHSFADLADEYADPVVAQTALPGYVESRYPNVTTLGDTTQTKWRHWFADPASVPRTPGQQGVGLFEGAFYVETGFYRPADQSFMRSTTGGFSPVHTEAWGLAVYRRAGGPIRWSAPTDGNITIAAGAPAPLTVARLLDPTAQGIAWYVNGTEVTAAANSETLLCCDGLGLAAGVHAVSALVFDTTGALPTLRREVVAPARAWSVTLQ